MIAQPGWLIAGPTGSGKSELALRVARELGGEIVNADSMQIYGDLRILTARPSAADEEVAAHHLFGVADGGEAWSVGRWLDRAAEAIAAIQGRGRTPIVVGGTGLYFRALVEGLADIPAISPAARAEARAAMNDLGEDAFRLRLGRLDEASEKRIAPGDRQRLQRAMEVSLGTDRPLSDWRETTRPRLDTGSWDRVVLDPERGALVARLDARLARMVEAGALEEVGRLVGRGLRPDLPVMKALGVPPLAAHLRGDLPLEAALDQTRSATRRYAKRQSTWFRRQSPDWPRRTT